MNLPFGYSLESNFDGAGLIFFGLLCITIFYTYVSNRHRGIRQLSKASLFFILFARVSTVTLLLVLIFEPQISLNSTFFTPQTAAIIIDQSRSMNQAWQGSASELTTNIRNIIARLEENQKVELWSMGGDEVQQASLTFEEDISSFDWNPQLDSREELNRTYSSIFLISDGQLNGGRSPLDSPWSSMLPVYPIYPLPPNSSAGLKIIESTFQSSDPVSDQIEILIKLQQEGLVGKTAHVEIRTDFDQLIGEASLRLTQVFSEIRLPVKLPSELAQTLKISVTLENGDFQSETYLNIEIQNPVKKVLIVSERVNELHKFLKLNLVDSLYQQSIVLGTGINRNDPSQALTDEKFDLIILNEPGPTVLSDKLATLLAANIKSKCPVILFNSGMEPLNSKWLNILGIQEQSAPYTGSDETAYWKQESRDHAFYLGLQGRGFAPEKILEYPPIQGAKHILTFNGADLIGVGIGEKYRSGFTLGDAPPLAIFNGAGYWKWFFHPQSKDSFQKFWDYLLIYLNDIANFEPVTINLDLKSAPTGAYIEAEVVVKDLDSRIIPAAELRVWQENESGEKLPLNLNREKSGAYSSQVNTKVPGIVTLIAQAYRFGELWGQDTSKLQLTSFNGEDQSKGVDEVFLTRLAKRSGGQVIQYLVEDLPVIPVKKVPQNASHQFKGVRSTALFALLVILLILEWIIRRRTGLL